MLQNDEAIEYCKQETLTNLSKGVGSDVRPCNIHVCDLCVDFYSFAVQHNYTEKLFVSY